MGIIPQFFATKARFESGFESLTRDTKCVFTPTADRYSKSAQLVCVDRIDLPTISWDLTPSPFKMIQKIG
jgi:hypothetical protein